MKPQVDRLTYNRILRRECELCPAEATRILSATGVAFAESEHHAKAMAVESVAISCDEHVDALLTTLMENVDNDIVMHDETMRRGVKVQDSRRLEQLRQWGGGEPTVT